MLEAKEGARSRRLRRELVLNRSSLESCDLSHLLHGRLDRLVHIGRFTVYQPIDLPPHPLHDPDVFKSE